MNERKLSDDEIYRPNGLLSVGFLRQQLLPKAAVGTLGSAGSLRPISAIPGARAFAQLQTFVVWFK